MAKKPSITTVSSGYQSTATINSNTQNLRDAFDNTLSLDGSTPNAMQADLDINSNDILNVNKLYINGLYIDGQPVSAGTLNYNGVIKETLIATSGQTVFNLTTMVYNPGINSLSVYVDGVYQNPSTYTENNSTRITFSTGLHVGAIVDFVALSVNEISGTADATSITYTPAGSGAVTTTVANKLKQTVSVKDFGAVGDGTTDDTAAIQAAVDAVYAAGGGVVYYPNSVYRVNSSIIMRSGVSHHGSGTLKIGSASAYSILYANTGTLEDVTIDGLSFDGSLNYPADSTVYKQTYSSLANGAIRVSGITAKRLTIRNCDFYKMSWMSIDINGYSSENIRIVNNTFKYGSYIVWVIGVRIPVGQPSSDADRPRHILISGNQIDTCGPQYFYDPSKEDWIASADAISVDSVMYCTISNNNVAYAAGCGIRVEDTLYCNVLGNTVSEAGQDGITLYKYTRYCNVVGNIVTNWGRIPAAYSMRSYSGSIYYAKEFPNSSYAPLPVDPSVSTWFSLWDYSTQNIDLSKVIPYSNTDYYVTSSEGILPFRGNSAFSVTSDSTKNSFSNNSCTGNLSVDGSGANLYASSFGFSPVHTVNSPSESGSGSFVYGHRANDVLVYKIYSPENADPINSPSVGTMTTSPITYTDCDTNNSIISKYNPIFGGPEGNFNAALTPATGSVSLQYNSLHYVKNGRQVTVTGQLALSGISSPTGAVTFSGLPFANRTSKSGTRDARTYFTVICTGLTGLTTGESVAGFLESGATSFALAINENGVYKDLSPYLTSSTGLFFSFTYLTDAV